MKAKLKGLSGPVIKAWFFTHGEKLAFGAAALVFVMLVYKAVGREVLPPEKEPPQLSSKTEQAKQHVARSVWDKNSLQPPVYVERAKREDVVAANYKLRAFDRPIYDIKGKRGDPAILPVEQLRVASGYGLLALLPPGGQAADVRSDGGDGQQPQNRIPGVRAPSGAKVEGKYWAVVTGLIPIKKQQGEYQKAFERAKAEDRVADVPTFRGYKIERAEVNPSAPDQLNWQALDKNFAKDFVAQWVTTAREVVAPKFIDSMFAMPLGPLLGEDWGADVAHPNEIPRVDAPPVPVEEKDPTQAIPEPAKPVDDFDIAVGRTPNKPNPTPEGQAAPRAPEKPAEYRLFRFFDFTVEPGKQYRYRVLLGLKNPNYQIPARFLKNPQGNQIEVLPAPMSEPSPVVFIAKAEQILAGPRPSERPEITGEPEAMVMLTKFDREVGTFASKEIKVKRGMITTHEGDVFVPDVVKGGQKKVPIRFDHNALVLDIRGGQELGSGRNKMVTPTEVLLFDADGNIVTGGNEYLARGEIDDAQTYRAKQLIAAPPAIVKPGSDDSPLLPGAGGGGILNTTPKKATVVRPGR